MAPIGRASWGDVRVRGAGVLLGFSEMLSGSWAFALGFGLGGTGGFSVRLGAGLGISVALAANVCVVVP